MHKKVFILLLLLIFIFLPSNVLNATSNNLFGDLDNSNTFNGIDLILLKRYLTGTAPDYVSTISADMTLDNHVNVQDLVRMKKYFSDDVTHINKSTKSLNWAIFDEGEELPLVSAVSFDFNTTCSIKTVCLPGRYTSEVSSFIKTDKNPNPELKQPDINISTTKINDTVLEIAYNEDNLIVEPSWIWKNAISYPNLDVSDKSKFNCLFTIMLTDKTVDPYRDFEVSFIF